MIYNRSALHKQLNIKMQITDVQTLWDKLPQAVEVTLRDLMQSHSRVSSLMEFQANVPADVEELIERHRHPSKGVIELYNQGKRQNLW
jgi:hypothetical protein